MEHGDELGLDEVFAQLKAGDMTRVEGVLVDEIILAKQIEIQVRHSMMGR